MTATLTDRDLREMAEARVGFRRHALTYVAFNVLFVAIWFLTSDERTLASYWPVWAHLGWGVGLAANAWCVYGAGEDAVKREEERLRARLQGRS